jgi:hypothetical protein
MTHAGVNHPHFMRILPFKTAIHGRFPTDTSAFPPRPEEAGYSGCNGVVSHVELRAVTHALSSGVAEVVVQVLGESLQAGRLSPVQSWIALRVIVQRCLVERRLNGLEVLSEVLAASGLSAPFPPNIFVWKDPRWSKGRTYSGGSKPTVVISPSSAFGSDGSCCSSSCHGRASWSGVSQDSNPLGGGA